MVSRAARQLLLIGLALALWSALGRHGWLELLGCYVASLVLVELALRDEALRRLPAWAVVALSGLLALPGVRFAYHEREPILEQAGLVGLGERLQDRARLAFPPVIAPPLWSTSRPQRFFVHAPDAQEVTVSFGAARDTLSTEPLGHGLFRLDYDPRQHGRPAVADGEIELSIATDGRSHARSVRVVSELAHPRWFCRSPDGRRAATTSEETDELIAVGEHVQRISVGDGPVDCAFVDEDTVVVSHRWAQELWVVELDAAPVSAQPHALSGPLGRLSFAREHGELLVARGGEQPAILHVGWPGLELRALSPLPAAADWLALREPQSLLVATRADASLHALERAGDHFVPTTQLRLGRPAATLAVAGDQVFVAVTDYHPGATPQLGNHFVQDQLLVVDARALTVVQRVLTARRSERQSKPGDMDQGGSPLGLWPLRDGKLAVAFAGTDEVWRLSLPQAEPEMLQVGSDEFYTPHGVVELHDGTLWLASPAAGSLAQLRPGAAAWHIVELAPSDRELMKQRPQALARRLGERCFYESTRSGIACQSCHLHADTDLAAYNLGDHRLIPTLGVRGLLGTAPYLRDGSYPRIGDLDEVAQDLYRGYPRNQAGRRYVLQSYVESLARELSVASGDHVAERRGYDVFLRARCARCHPAPAFTNLGQLPMAALFPRAAELLPKPESLDVPSLLSVSASAPYLHDGRAATLADVLDRENPDNMHGDTRSLSPAERADLLQFLSSL